MFFKLPMLSPGFLKLQEASPFFPVLAVLPGRRRLWNPPSGFGGGLGLLRPSCSVGGELHDVLWDSIPLRD